VIALATMQERRSRARVAQRYAAQVGGGVTDPSPECGERILIVLFATPGHCEVLSFDLGT
jgi:hypothetical protein